MKILVVISAFFVCMGARAGILIEPYVGYQSLATDISFGSDLANGSAKLDTTGPSYGLRVGGTFARAFLALDYSTGTMKTKMKELTSGLTVSTLRADMGRAAFAVTGGIDLVLIRPYAGYIFSDVISFGSYYLGSGYKVGVGIGILPFLKLNFEYQAVTYTKARDAGGVETTLADSRYIKGLTNSGYLVGLSLPLDL